MSNANLLRMEVSIARCRLILSTVALLAVFVDPTPPLLSRWLPLTSGPFKIDPYVLILMGSHLAYSAALYVCLVRDLLSARRLTGSIWVDVLFGAAIAFLTEGVSSPFYAFFSFAVVVAGFRAGLRQAVLVTAASVALYLCLIAVSGSGEINVYIMRPAYLAIAGYLVGYLGQQRLELQEEIRRLEAAEQRHRIARDLHDGFAQALAGINLQIASCRRSLDKADARAAAEELVDLQHHVNREYDDLRAYMRSLAGAGAPTATPPLAEDTRFSVRADLCGSGELVEHVLQITREGVHNAAKHARANSARVEIRAEQGNVHIRIEDDGVGFSDSTLPWSIASRVHQLGGELRLDPGAGGQTGASLAIVLPQG